MSVSLDQRPAGDVFSGRFVAPDDFNACGVLVRRIGKISDRRQVLDIDARLRRAGMHIESLRGLPVQLPFVLLGLALFQTRSKG